MVPYPVGSAQSLPSQRLPNQSQIPDSGEAVREFGKYPLSGLVSEPFFMVVVEDVEESDAVRWYDD